MTTGGTVEIVVDLIGIEGKQPIGRAEKHLAAGALERNRLLEDIARQSVLLVEVAEGLGAWDRTGTVRCWC